ncbi:MFS transporter [Fluviicola sp.]|uniref:MFS transporter n=1 Tax=Fluviicola sp. TaxID=1917219 RepID=UPI0031D0D4CC
MKSLRQISMFRSFQNRNYRIFFAGQSVSQIGTWMQRTAISWLVYSQTHSTFMLGLTIFASLFPSFLLSVFGGVVSDRFNRHKVLFITQGASMIQSLVLTILVLTDHYSIWMVIVLTTFLGIINAFDVPARQPLVNDLVKDKEELPNAIALNSAMVNLARLLGPALSGITLEFWGAGICFLINTISFAAVLISLFLLKLPEYKPKTEKKKVVAELVEGFNYLKNHPTLSVILLLLISMSLFVMPYDTLIPVFAKITFHGNASTFGLISSFIGFGAICSTLFLASLKPGTDLKYILLINTFVLGFGLICFSHITYFPVAMIFAIMAGFGGMTQTTICITLIQVHSDAVMRGRIISFLAMAIFGMLPLGSLLVGAASQRIGPANTILVQGFIALLIGVIFSNNLRADKLKKKDKQVLETVEDQLIETL